MFGSTGHTVAELDYYFKLFYRFRLKRFRVVFLSNYNKMTYEAFELFSHFFYGKIISNRIDYIIKKFFLNNPNNLGLDFGLSTIKHGYKSGNYPLDFVFKKYINYFKLRKKYDFNPFENISFSEDLKYFLNSQVGKSKYIIVQIKEEKGNSTILKTDPKTYIKTIKFYQKKNYKVILAGRKEKIPKEFQELGVIDYSKFKNTSFQTDLNLISKSELVISSASGFACIAQVYDKPLVYSNSWHIVLTPSSRYCVHLPYKFINKKTGLFTSYDEIINFYLFKCNQLFLGEDIYEVLPNTDQEILEASIEAMNLKKKYFEPHKIYLNFKNRYDKVPIKYCETRISTEFVKKNHKLF